MYWWQDWSFALTAFYCTFVYAIIIFVSFIKSVILIVILCCAVAGRLCLDWSIKGSCLSSAISSISSAWTLWSSITISLVAALALWSISLIAALALWSISLVAALALWSVSLVACAMFSVHVRS